MGPVSANHERRRLPPSPWNHTSRLQAAQRLPHRRRSRQGTPLTPGQQLSLTPSARPPQNPVFSNRARDGTAPPPREANPRVRPPAPPRRAAADPGPGRARLPACVPQVGDFGVTRELGPDTLLAQTVLVSRPYPRPQHAPPPPPSPPPRPPP